MELHQALSDLVRASDALAAADPADLAVLEEILRGRDAAIERAAAAVSRDPWHGGVALSEAVRVFAYARKQGAEAYLRMRLARAAVRSELDALNHDERVLRTLAPHVEASGHGIDCSG